MPDSPLTVDVTRSPEESAGQRRSRLRLAGMLLVSSIAHFIIPRAFMKIVPRFLGHARFWVYASGVVEAAAGALMLSADPTTRRRGGSSGRLTTSRHRLPLRPHRWRTPRSGHVPKTGARSS